MNVSERLVNYNPSFSTETIEAIVDMAEWQMSLESYSDFFQAVGVNGLTRVTKTNIQPVDVLDIRRQEELPNAAIVYHLPMANPLDANQIYQAATIAQATPNHRLIALARPSGLGFGSGLIDRPERKTVAKGNFGPVIEPLLRYLDSEKIFSVSHVGYSYGVSTAIAAAERGDQHVPRTVLIEPAAVIKRNLVKLGMAFAASAKHLDKYVEATGLDSFKAARQDSVTATNYNFGLLRASNIAVARALTRGGFEGRVHSMLEAQPDMRTMVAWGANSELAADKRLRQATTRLRTLNQQRLKSMRLENQYHALANDVHLQAAIVREGLK